MAKIVQIRRGSTDQHKNFPGEEGEITVDLTDKTIRVHDGTDLNGRATLDVNLPTGYPLARADMSNVAGSIGIKNCFRIYITNIFCFFYFYSFHIKPMRLPLNLLLMGL